MMKTKLLTLFAAISLSWPAIAQEPDSSLVQRLADLAELYEQGLLSDAEFATAKEVILSNNNLTDNEQELRITAEPSADVRVANDEEINQSRDVPTLPEALSEGIRTVFSNKQVWQAAGNGSDQNQIQVILQGNLIEREVLSAAQSLLVGAAAVAANVSTGGLGGLAAQEAISRGAANALLSDDLSYVPVSQNILDEVARLSECYAVERNMAIKSLHFVPSNRAYSAPQGFAGYESLTAYWEDYLELNNAWTIDENTDEIVWINYNLVVPNDYLIPDNINDISLLAASGSVATFNADGPTFVESGVMSANSTNPRKIFSELLKRLFPDHTPSFPHPDCGLRSKVLLKLKEEINEESEISDIESFFESLNVRYERDRSKRTLSGVLKLDNQDVNRIDYPVKIEVFHTRRPRRFERAVITNIYD